MSVPLVRQNAPRPGPARPSQAPDATPPASRRKPTASQTLAMDPRNPQGLPSTAKPLIGVGLKKLAQLIEAHPKGVIRAAGALTGVLGLLVLADGVKDGSRSFDVDPVSRRIQVRPQSFAVEGQGLVSALSRRDAGQPSVAQRLQSVVDHLQERVDLPPEALRRGFQRLGPATLLLRAEDPGLPAALGAAAFIESLPSEHRQGMSSEVSSALDAYSEAAPPGQAWPLALAGLLDHDWPQSTAELALPLMDAALPPPGRIGSSDWGDQAVTWGSRALAAAYKDELAARLLPTTRPKLRQQVLESLSSLSRLASSATDPQTRHDLVMLGVAAREAAKDAPGALELMHDELGRLAGNPYSPAPSAPAQAGAVRALLSQLLHQYSARRPLTNALAVAEVAWPMLPPGATPTDVHNQRVARYRYLALDSGDTAQGARLLARGLQMVWAHPALDDVGGPTSHLQETIDGANRQFLNLHKNWGLPLPPHWEANGVAESPAGTAPAEPSPVPRLPDQVAAGVPSPPVQAPEDAVAATAVQGAMDEADHPDASELLERQLASPLPPRDPSRRPHR